MFDFLKKKVDEYDAGYTLASDMYDYHLANTGCQDKAYGIVATHFEVVAIHKTSSERLLQGATGFLIETFQKKWSQIPVDTLHDQAVKMLQFANGGVTKPEPPSVDGWTMAFNLYNKLTQLDDLTPCEAVGYIQMNYRTIYAELSFNEKTRFKEALRSLENRAMLEKAFNA
jgi:hypothetical protein